MRNEKEKSHKWLVVHCSLCNSESIFRFEIDENGLVTVANSGMLDYELRHQFTLSIVASDTGGLRNDAQLVIVLNDVNDNTPEFQQPEYRAFVKENNASFPDPVIVKVYRL